MMGMSCIPELVANPGARPLTLVAVELVNPRLTIEGGEVSRVELGAAVFSHGRIGFLLSAGDTNGCRGIIVEGTGAAMAWEN